MWYFYVLRCGDGSLYAGVTSDLKARLAKHRAGVASKYTRAHLPVTLAYSEKYRSRSKAMSREAQVKRWDRHEKLALISK